MGRRIDSTLLTTLLIGAVACGKPAEPSPNDQLGSSTSPMRGDVRIDGDATFCFTGSGGNRICDNGVLSKGDSVETLEGIIGTTAVIRGGSYGCTATLVTRRHVLTAAHCVNRDLPPSEYSVWFPQAGGFHAWGADPDGWEWVGPIPFDEFSRHHPGNDTALLRLREPVPPDVVRHIAPVWMGKITDALSAATELYAVGFGTPNTSRRQYGEVDSAWRRHDSCNKWWLEGSCMETPVITNTRYNDVRLDKGDSGGPLFAKVNGVFHVVGVASGWANYGSGLEEKLVQYWAPVGSPTRVNQRIGSMVDEDLDNDGVKDGRDNCPPSACSGPLDCWNPGQEDYDHDGVGEVCDNCPAKACANTPGLDCRNARQRDADLDGIGDVCDLCPELANRKHNGDADGDLVGDACEVCDAFAMRIGCDPNKAFACTDENAGRCVFDYDLLMGALPGYCSRLSDPDKDGVPEGCDLCPDDYDETNANANQDIEDDHDDFERLGDVCDPVPQLDFSAHLKLYNDYVPPPQGQGLEGPDWIRFVGTALLADDGDSGTPRSTTEAVSFRHCDCYGERTGLELPEEECLAIGSCRAISAQLFEGDWKEIEVGREDGTREVTFDVRYENEDRRHAAGDFIWKWLEDADKGVVESRMRKDFKSTHGLVASVVGRTEAATSGRDKDWYLRVVRRLVWTPFFEWASPPLRIRIECKWPFCGGFIPDMRHVYEPWEWLHDGPMPFVVRDGKFILLGDGTSFDETARFSELMAFVDGDTFAFIPRSGDNALDIKRSKAEDFVLGVLLPRQGSGCGTPMRVLMREGNLVVGWPGHDLGESSLAVISDLGRAVYSAREDAVYIVGGEHGTPDASLRRFSFVDSSTTVFEDVAIPGGEAPGLAFDPVRNRIYLLFKERSADDTAVARLTIVEPGRWGDSKDLLVVPYDAADRHVALAMGPGGEVVIASNREEYVVAWMFEFDDDYNMTPIGSWKTAGSLVDLPHPGLPILIIATSEDTRVVRLRRSDFEPGIDLVDL